MSVTIKKIAKDLNLAVSTVSKALRDSHEISAETKARVFEYAAKLDYIPNPYASSLKKGRSGNIAVVLPEVADSFFSAAINGIESIAHDKGYHTMVYLTHEDVQREQSIVREFRNGRVDGVLMSIVANDEKYEHLTELYGNKIPLVFFDRVCEGIEAASVVTNDFDSAYAATKHLLDQGCKRVVFLSMPGELAIIKHRQHGYIQALNDHGLTEQVVYCTDHEDDNHTIIEQLLTNNSRPDGIIGSIEKVTMPIYKVCHAHRIAIPYDIKIIGFSHLQIASLLDPPLTTVTQPAFEMGKAAATILFKALEKKYSLKNERIVIPSILNVRASTQAILRGIV
jgi:LacI family transcriptional regulator